MKMKDSNKDFSRIQRFDPVIGVIRGHSGSHRRVCIVGHEASQHLFIIQHPAAKQCRREERTEQLFRLLNPTLERSPEARKRNLRFHVPTIVPLAPQIRLVQDDRSNISLQQVFETHAKKNGIHKDDPILYFTNKLKHASLNENLAEKSVTIT